MDSSHPRAGGKQELRPYTYIFARLKLRTEVQLSATMGTT